MSSANDRNTGDLPPIPEAGESGPDVCAVVRLYLAIIDDLTPQQVAQLSEHVVTCAACGEMFETLERSTHLVGSLSASEPSPRIDAAMLTLMEGNTTRGMQQRARRPIPARRRRAAWIVGELVAAAAIILALFTSIHLFGLFGGGGVGPQTAFSLPASLSWSQFVLYHSETRTSTDGELYQVESYHDLATGSMHVETKMDGRMDVVAVGNHQQMLGMDTIHHVAQMGANRWSVDDSLFDLDALRHELQIGQATYMDIDNFKGQSVYRIRMPDGLVMLLDMQYMPVNVLRGAVGPGTGYPIYTDLKLLPSSQVPGSMWDMNIPPGYHMGSLPPEP